MIDRLLLAVIAFALMIIALRPLFPTPAQATDETCGLSRSNLAT